MTDSTLMLDDVVAAYSDDFEFDRTQIPVLVATMGSDEFLVSRSAARRIVLRLERFREVLLDFDGVSTIGQAFADEIFRVFANDHPDVRLVPLNTSRQVGRMIERALANRADPTLGL